MGDQLADKRQMVIDRNRAQRLAALAQVEARAQAFNARRAGRQDTANVAR